MPAVRRLPDNRTLVRWSDEGLTQAEMCERIFQDSGYRPSRSSISAALSRAGLSKEMNRYNDTIPWRVKNEHLREYPARMLRLLGRRRSNSDLTDEENRRLDSWLTRLNSENAVVAYDPESVTGFVYVDREPKDSADIPIRKQPVRLLD